MALKSIWTSCRYRRNHYVYITIFALALVFFAISPVWQVNARAIWTTDSEGERQDQNIYHYRCAVYLDGDDWPANTTLYIRVTTTSGGSLNYGGPSTVMTDGNGEFGPTGPLCPYDIASNGEYKAWASLHSDFTQGPGTKTDNFKVEIFVPAARLTLSGDDTNAVGDTHTFTALLEIDADGNGSYETKPTGEDITFAITGTGDVGTLSNETSTVNGVATVDVDSTTAGTSTVTASWNGTVANVTVTATPDSGIKTWFVPAAKLTMSADDVNAVGDTHTFTALLEIDADGNGSYETKPTGEDITFAITGTGDVGTLSNETSTVNGVATVDVDSTTAGTSTVTASWNGTVANVTVTATPDSGIKTWFVPAAKLTMSADDVNAVGDTHTFTALLEIDADGNGSYETKPTGEDITFAITGTGDVGTLSNETSTVNGVATVDVDSTTAGTSTVTASWNGTVANVTVTATPDSGIKTWFVPAAKLTMSADDVNAVGDTHTFTALLEIDADGNGSYETKPTGEDITFAITGTGDVGTLSNETSTVNGVATVDVDSTTAGTSTVTASWNGTVANVTVTATPDSGIKTWFVPAAKLTMSADDVNAVGDTHTFTALLEIDADGNGSYETKPTGEDITFAITGTGDVGTLSNETSTVNGVATVDVDSTTAGTSTVTASWNGTVANVTVTATPDSGIKTWFVPAAKLTMSADDVNAVGDTHTFTALLEIDADGNGSYETKPTGEDITFAITGTGDVGTLSNETSTVNGVATVDVDSTTAGTSTVTASWNGTVANVTVTATPDSGIKTWFVPAAKLTMSADDVNAVGDTHTFTALLEIDADGNGSYETKPTGEDITFAITGTGDVGTLSNETSTVNGVATVDVDSTTAGTSTVTASWNGTVANVTVTATPDSGIKTWFVPAAKLTMSADDVNAVGDTHTFTALLEIDADGNGSYETKPTGEDITFAITGTGDVGTLSNETSTVNGVATVDVDSTTAGTSTVTASWNGTVANVTVTATPDSGIKTWFVPAAKLTMSADDVNAVGDTHTFTALLEIDADGNGSYETKPTGEDITFAITGTGDVGTLSNETSTVNGVATVDVDSTTAGTSTVTASWNGTVANVTVTATPDSGIKTWFVPAAKLTMSADDVNAVGDTHTFTALLEIDADGNGSYETKPTGEDITFAITGTGDVGTLSNETSTVNGVATVDVDSTTAGTSTVTASWNGTVANVTVTATPDSGIKTWFVPAAKLTMSADDVNAVGDTHTFTALLEIDADGNGSYETKPTGEDITFAITGTGDVGTLSNETSTVNGVATVDVDSTTAGTSTVTASWNGTVANVTVTATPDSGIKTWFVPAAKLTMSADDVNAVGDTHTFTALLEIDADGNGSYETKPTGEDITFAITGTGDVGTLSNETSTVNGVATVDVDSTTAGTSTVTASWNGTVANVTVTATPDSGIKTWFVPAAKLTMSADDVNAVGDTHTFTALLEIDADGNGSYETKPTGEDITFAITGTGDVGTLSNETSTVNGVATVDVDSTTAGTSTVTASWNGTVANVTVTATPDSGIKTWFVPAAKLTMSADDVNAVGDTHTFTALLEIDADGNGSYETKPTGEDITFAITGTGDVGTLSNETSTVNGVATVDVDSTTAGTSTVTASWNGTVANVTVTATPDSGIKTWFVPAAKLTMSADDVNAVGDTHTFTALLEIDADGNGSYETKPTGEDITFAITGTGDVGTLSNETSTVNGVATVDVDSTTAGTSTVTASWNGTVANVTVTATPDSGIKTWFVPAAKLTMSADDVNAVGDTHTFTALLEIDADGNGSYETKPTGEDITFAITGTGDVGTLSNETSTVNGVATVDVDSTTAGTSTVTASWNGTVANVTVTATPDSGIKTWFVPAAKLTMSADDVNAVGDTHTFTALLEIDADGNGSYETKPTGEDITFAITGTGDVGTLSNETSTVNGVATVDVDSTTAGTSTVTASWNGTVANVTVTATPDSGIKTWFVPAAKLTMSADDVNAVGDTHTFTALLEIDADGNGSYETKPTGEDITFAITGTGDVGTLSNETSTVNGVATVDVDSTTAGTSTVTASWNGTVANVTVTATPDSGIKTWFVPAAKLTMSADDVNAVGDTHTFTALLEIDADGNGSYETKPTGEDITFAITGTGDVGTLSNETSTVNGVATVDVDSTTAGTSTVTASWNGTVANVTVTATPDSGIKTWFVPAAKLTMSADDVNAVGDTHTFTALLEIDADGNGSYETKPTGEDITFAITGTGDVGTLSNETSTVNGVATVDVDSTTAGTSTVTASWNGTVANVTVTATPDSGIKTWFVPAAKLTMSADDVNAVGDTHTFTALLEIDADGNGSYETKPTGEDITFAITGTGDVGTLSNETSTVNGVATVDVDSTTAGTSTVTASWNGTVANVTVTATPDSGIKTWFVPGLMINKTGPGSVDIGGTITYDITISNTGDVVLHNVLFNDAKLGITNRDLGDIAVGGSVTLHPTYGPVTESDLPGPIVNTAIADSDEAGPVEDGHSVIINTDPNLSIDKTGPATIAIGGTITYDITISNTGDVVLHNVLFNDAKLGITNQDLGDIAVGGSVTIHPTYGPVTESDLPGPIVNTAIADSDEAGPVEDGHSVIINTDPNLSIDKTGPATIAIGGTITYDITISNTGDVVLHNVLFNDAKLGITNRDLGDIAVGGSVTIHPTYGPVTESDLPGPIVNTAIADSDEAGPVEDGHSVIINTDPNLSIDKTGPATIAIGGTITYDITISNTGDVVLHNVLFNDAKLGITNQDLGDIAVGGSVTIHPTYGPVTESDLPGPIVNTAIADSDEAGPVEDGHSVEIVTNPGIAIEKATNGEDADSVPGPSIAVGDPITWTYTVTNTGNVTLTNISVADDKLGYVGTIALLAPGASQTLTKTGTAVAGQYANTGTATVSYGETTYSDSDDSYYFGANPSIAIEKTPDTQQVISGTDAMFHIRVENTGDVSLTNVVISDPLAPNCASVTIGTLAVGAVYEYDCVTPNVTTSFVNEAIVTGEDPSGNPVTDTDTARVMIITSSISVVKEANVNTANVGDTVIYTYRVTNTGDGTLSNITLVDDKLGAIPLGTTTLESGESVTVTTNYTVQEIDLPGPVVNVATATGTDSADNTVTDEAQETVDITAGGGGATEDTCEGRVIINEVAWAGTAADSRDEWIELRNLGTIPVDLTGWTLRWRRKQPTTEEEYRWKVVNLSGILLPASTSACELADKDPTPSVEFIKRDTDDLSWWVLGKQEEKDGSYYTIERRHDETISNEKADLIYDTTEPYEMDLTDLGDVIQLRNDHDEVVDTANASNPERDGWPAGSAATFATMERTNPLAPDTWENWHTNLGIITRGLDAQERPLIATADVLNSQALEELALAAHLAPTKTRAGARLEVGLDLPREDRKTLGWPWIRVTRPDLAEAAGGGGAVEAGAGFSFSGRYSGDLYWLEIDTSGLSPGQYHVWIVYGEGKAILVPILVL